VNLDIDPLGLAGLHEFATTHDFIGLSKHTAPGYLKHLKHGDLPRWIEALGSLPKLIPETVDLEYQVAIGHGGQTSESQQQALSHVLETLVPWRKGPFDLFGVELDSEWRCNMKWDRLLQSGISFADKTVLDVGCGNGYFGLRAIGKGARLALGLEPYLLYAMQFQVLKSYLPELPIFVLPVKLEDFQGPRDYFDTILTMGVLYHVRSPLDHLIHLKRYLRPGGQLVVETLIVDGPEGYCLTPSQRYARMPNVWFVPTLATLTKWLIRCGYQAIEVKDVTATDAEEQRATRWMPFASLQDGLNPDDPGQTIEGLPAPRRAIVTASINDK